MKITKGILQKIIKEEIEKMLEKDEGQLQEIESDEEQKVAGKSHEQEDYSEDFHTIQEKKKISEVTPPGYEKIVKGIKKSVSQGDTPKTYVSKSGERKETSPFAIANSMKNKGVMPKK